jgi:hypothetical protein
MKGDFASRSLRVAMSLWPLLLASQALGQSYSIDWFTVDGGGGTSTGGVYSVSGTIGQPDVDKTSGGNYTLEGGFWGVVAAVQVTGSPVLSIRSSAGNAVVVVWPYPSTGFGLQQNANAGTTNWLSATNVPVHVGNEWQVTVPLSASNRFYRLKVGE